MSAAQEKGSKDRLFWCTGCKFGLLPFIDLFPDFTKLSPFDIWVGRVKIWTISDFLVFMITWWLSCTGQFCLICQCTLMWEHLFCWVDDIFHTQFHFQNCTSVGASSLESQEMCALPPISTPSFSASSGGLSSSGLTSCAIFFQVKTFLDQICRPRARCWGSTVHNPAQEDPLDRVGKKGPHFMS